MVSTYDALELFPFIEPEHQFFPQIAGFAAAVRAHPQKRELLARLAAGERTAIHAEVKALPTPEGSWTLDRFYWSFQYWDAAQPLPFQALTLHYSAKTGATTWQRFPNDAYLSGMAAFFAGWQKAEGGRQEAVSEQWADVLRYVPLRRLTLRLGQPDGRRAIGKFKRRSRFRAAYERLVAIAAGAARNDMSFDVALPCGLDETHCLVIQSDQPGQDLATLLASTNCVALLERVGQLHHELHSLELANLPRWDFAALLPSVQRDLNWIAFCRPAYGPLLEAIGALLLRELPTIDTGETVCCHGDFVCSQILATDGRWSVIDWDLCQWGDPYREIALLLASLRYDVPFFQHVDLWSNMRLLEQASAAYLHGYQQRAGRALDERRLLWHRICAEVYYLALMLKKDWFTPWAFDHSITLLDQLQSALVRERDR